ncbi:hypothetical protein [Arthrobacter sp. NIO-1057]|uniref:hypothetical protein n=1 Tax=Arthrobacter sp. NIO-1057 TaxID=993071 RepID=UPI00071CFE52|nr:hypothetical protein [Arthrobacter sp. NIO-1057]KSU67869.1 hypothetical protein AS038_01900 [Arthrobacter sp. NIO-1057]SCB81600.1 hypothetical protein GA0061084_0387 [Arthrobacter sp. NIO-1057]
MNVRRFVAGFATAGLLSTGLIFGSAPAQAAMSTHVVREKNAFACSVAFNDSLKKLKGKYVRVTVLQKCHWEKTPGYRGYYEARIRYDTSGTSS